MKLYRFSPIHSGKGCIEALEYTQLRLKELSRLVLDDELPINTLKIFAHYQDEYAFLKSWADSLGTSNDEGSSTSHYVKPDRPLAINNELVELVGIRVPDPYRGQVGCGDYVIPNFDDFKARYLAKSPYVREVPHPKYQMLELFHPDIDVLGYIVKSNSSV